VSNNKSPYLSQALSILNRTQGANRSRIRAIGFLQQRLNANKRAGMLDDASPRRQRPSAHEHATPPSRS